MKETIYRGHASPEVDAAWEALGTDCKSPTQHMREIMRATDFFNTVVMPILVPEKDAERYGLASGMVKRKAEVGGGFPAQVDTFHLLHCLVCLIT